MLGYIKGDLLEPEAYSCHCQALLIDHFGLTA